MDTQQQQKPSKYLSKQSSLDNYYTTLKWNIIFTE